MQESYGEGLATRTGPESCAAVREAVTGEWVGRVISRERPLLRAPRPSREAEGHMGGVDTARCPRVWRGPRPRAWPDPPRARTGRARGGPTGMARRGRIGKSKDACR